MRKIVLPLTALAVSITLSACSSLQRQDLSTSGTISPAETLLPISQEDLQALAAPSEFSAPGEFTKDSLYTLLDRKSTRLNSSHVKISYAVFCLKKKTNTMR